MTDWQNLSHLHLLFADKNLPNSSSVEVEVTPPMNGTAGQEGETVRSGSAHTHTRLSTLTMRWRQSKEWDVKVSEALMNISSFWCASVFHLKCDWCKGYNRHGTGHYCCWFPSMHSEGELLHLQPQLPKTRLSPLSAVITLLANPLLHTAGCARTHSPQTQSATNNETRRFWWRSLTSATAEGSGNQPSRQTFRGQKGRLVKVSLFRWECWERLKY